MMVQEAIMSDKGDTSVCDYEFNDENLQALWTEFQRSEQATCPETGAEIRLELTNDASSGEPSVNVICEKCGRKTEFKPGPLEGFDWAE